MSICLPVDFLSMSDTAKEACVWALLHNKAKFFQPFAFQRLFWQSEWRILLPNCDESELINFLIVTNTFDNDKWVPVAVTLYNDSHLLAYSQKLTRILVEKFEAVEDSVAVEDAVCVGMANMNPSNSAIPMGRFLGLLFITSNVALDICDCVAIGLIAHLHLWLYHAVHKFDPTFVDWCQCSTSGCQCGGGRSCVVQCCLGSKIRLSA